MSEVVDSIVAELIARDNGYISTFDRAISKHKEFTRTVPKVDGLEVLAKGAQQYADQHNRSLDQAVAAEQRSTEKITQSRKRRVDATKAADDAEVASARRAANARIAEAERIAERERRLDENAKRRVIHDRTDTNTYRPGPGRQAGSRAAFEAQNVQMGQPAKAADILAERNRQRAAEAESVAAAEAKVKSSLADQALLRAGIANTTGKQKQALQDMLADLRLETTLRKQGIKEEEIAANLESVRAQRVRHRVEMEALEARGHGGVFGQRRGGQFSPLNEAVINATRGRFGYSLSPMAFGGLAVGAAAFGAVAAVQSATELAKGFADVSKEAGISTTALQVYQRAALDAGATQEQFNTALGALGNALGRAKQGDQGLSKLFGALGINIKNAASAGDLLPTLIDRLSSIPDAAQRAAIETRLFGESGRKLDSMLSGGNDKINALAEAMQRAGAVLSDSDIAKLDDTAKKLAEVKAQLSVDVAQVVANNADAIERLAKAIASLADGIPSAIRQYQAFVDRLKIIQGEGREIVGTILQGAGLGGREHILSGQIQVQRARADMRRLKADQDTDDVNKTLSGVDATDAFLNRLKKDTKVQSGKVDTPALGKVLAPKGRSGGSGKSASQLESETEQRTRRFNDELARLQDQELQARADMTGDVEERAAIENELALRALHAKEADIDSDAKRNILRGADAKLEKARAAELKAAAEKVEKAQSDLREQGITATFQRAMAQHAETLLSVSDDMLNSQLGVAQTSKERLAIELRLLANAKERERIELQTTIDTAKPGDPAAIDARKRLDTLDQRYAGHEAGIRDRNKSPGQQYLQGLEVNSDTIEDHQVRALEAFNNGLDQSVNKALRLHGVLGQIVGDLVDMAIKQALIRPLAAQMFGGGGGGGGIFGSIGSILGLASGNPFAATDAGIFSSISTANAAGDASILASLPGLAGGGSFVVGGRGGIDRNVLSINGDPTIRVNNGERIAVIPPSIGSGNGRVSPSGGQTTIVQHFTLDARHGITTPQLLDHVNEVARRQAAVAGAVSYQAAVRTAADQTPGSVARYQKQKG